MFNTTNPYNGEALQTYEGLDAQELQLKLDKAGEAFMDWGQLPVAKRVEYLNVLKELLADRIGMLSKVMSTEMGKPVKEAEAELKKCIRLCEYYADHAEVFLSSRSVSSGADESMVVYDPLGVILGIMPWNFPFWQVFRFAVPTLLAGNTCLLKHAPNVAGCAKLIDTLFKDSGFPEGVFQNLFITVEQVKTVIAHRRVRGVSLTGSEKAGRAVAETAGGHLKKVLLELGGSNALIVCSDADLERAADTAVRSRFQNTGQSCIAAKRILVHQSVMTTFTQLFLEKVKTLKTGDPLDPETTLGVIARKDLAETLEAQLKESLNQGAELLFGGKRQRTHFEPTVIATIDHKIKAMQEETFGPLAVLYPFETMDEAVKVANDTPYGLGVSVFTGDTRSVRSYIPKFNEGAVFINEMVMSDPRLPFGGVKNSGMGRELGKEGILEFTNVKTVYINR